MTVCMGIPIFFRNLRIEVAEIPASIKIPWSPFPR
jgi:hypothetical protein